MPCDHFLACALALELPAWVLPKGALAEHNWRNCRAQAAALKTKLWRYPVSNVNEVHTWEVVRMVFLVGDCKNQHTQYEADKPGGGGGEGLTTP